VDFASSAVTGSLPVSQGNNAIWNVSLWSTPTYWGDAAVISKNWIGIGGIGYAASLQLAVSSRDVKIQWQATDYVFRKGGML
jgi:hypothetical protein